MKISPILWPEICPFCGRVFSGGVCPNCRKVIDRLLFREPRCMCCGRTVRYAEQEYCPECQKASHVFDQGLPLWAHQKPVSSSIYQFKFHNLRSFAPCYAGEILDEHGKRLQSWRVGLFLPIPLHPKRRRLRGYNQAELLAAELGKRLGIPMESEVVLRRKATVPQKDLDPKKRKQNLAGAFAMKRRDVPKVKGKNVCLVDDIYTTGSTMDAVSEVLREAGAKRVYFLTISAGNYL